MNLTIDQKNFLIFECDLKEIKAINKEFLFLYDMLITNKIDPSGFQKFTEMQSLLNAAEAEIRDGNIQE